MGEETVSTQTTSDAARAAEELFINKREQPAREDRNDGDPAQAQQESEEFFRQNIQEFTDPANGAQAFTRVDAPEDAPSVKWRGAEHESDGSAASAGRTYPQAGGRSTPDESASGANPGARDGTGRDARIGPRPDPDGTPGLQHDPSRSSTEAEGPAAGAGVQVADMRLPGGNASDDPPDAGVAGVSAVDPALDEYASELLSEVNESPTGITLAGGSIDENAAPGALVANLSALDPDGDDGFSFSLQGDPSGLFVIEGSQVKVRDGAEIDFESGRTHDLTVQVTDSAGNTFAQVVTIDVADVNEGPTDIELDGGSVAENSLAGTVVATLSANDEDTGDTFTYRIIDDPSGSLEVVGNEVRVKVGAQIDYESAPSHAIRLEVTDSAGNTYEKDFTIAVNDVNESTPGETVVGTGGQDHLTGTAGDDLLEGGRGDDVLDGGAGDDTFKVYGDAGTDQIDGGDGYDVVQGTRYNDVIRVTDNLDNLQNLEAIDGGDGYDVIQGGSGNDTLDFSSGPALTNVEEIDGGYGNDHIIGSTGNDHIEGNRGDDVLHGGAGDDTFKVYGDAGTDQIDGGDGYDVVQGTRYNDVIRVTDNLDNLQNLEAIDGGDGYDVIQGGSGNDTLDFSSGPALTNVEEIDGGYGNDHIIGSAGNDHIEGNRGDDVLHGGAGDDTFKVYGDAGTDQIDGGDGYDVVQGTRYNDVIRVTDNLDNLQNLEAIDGGDGYDVIQGGSGNDTLDFSSGPALTNVEEIDGGYGNDHIIGSAGNDHIEGNRGDDVLHGGAGDDTFKVYGDAGTDQIDGGDGYDVIQGTRYNDVIRVTDNLDNLQNLEAIDGGDGYDVIQGGSGNDTLDFSSGPALTNVEEIDGGYGNDHIIGSAGNDHIEGNRGDDVLHGGAGDDTFKVYGDAGTDQIDGGDGYDVVQGTRYNDVIRVTDNLDNLQNLEAIDGGDGYDVIQGGSGNDTLDFSSGPALTNVEEIDGGYGNDHIIGSAGNDHIEGNRGDDVLHGGAGDDTFKVYGDAGTDQIDGGDGYDVVQGTRYNDVIRVTDNLDNLQNLEAIDGGDGYDVIQGGSGNDTLDFSSGPALTNVEEIDGGYGNDHIIGSAGNDHIEGNRGDDVLHGGAGDDTLRGGQDDDRLEGGAGDDSAFGEAGNDVYVFNPFEGNDSFDGGGGWTDVIQLDATADPGADPNNPWEITVNGEQVEYDLAMNALELDPDSSGAITLADGSELVFEGVDRIVW